jgi:methyl-accepting chemotaxis protein
MISSVLVSQKFRLSLAAKVMTLTFCLVAVQGGAALYSSSKLGMKLEKKEIGLLENLRNQFSSIVSALFYERYGDVQAFAANPAFSGTNVKEMEEVLNTYTSLYLIYQGIIFTDIQGNIVASNVKDATGKNLDTNLLKTKNFANSDWFKAAVEERYVTDKNSGITGSYVGPVEYDEVSSALTGKKQFGMYFSAPVKNKDGKIIGVLSTRSDMEWVEAEAKKFLQATMAQTKSEVTISMIDKNGKYILDYDMIHLKGERDYDVVGKLNAVEAGNISAKKALAGEVGSGYANSPREKNEVYSAFGKIKNSKFPEELGWSVFVEADPAGLLMEVNKSRNESLATFAVLILGSLVAGYFFSRKLSGQFVSVSEKLQLSADKTASVAQELSHSAELTAASISEQAAAVQETVSSMSEMSSMITQTSTNSKESLNLSSEVANQTREGNKIMEKLSHSMESIQQGNAQLRNFTNILQEIESKTAVINDIVFKTQLLSFNASIEAARAGQHGRGFAVVASEVGNLAKMSGSAAKEIQTLLESSKRQVDTILDNTSERVSEGRSVTVEALTIFSEIAKKVEGISIQVRSIVEATQEQDVGVKQTSLAMMRMDELSQRNNEIAQLVSHSASELENQAVRLHRIMLATRNLVVGSSDKLPESSEEEIQAQVATKQGHENQSKQQALFSNHRSKKVIPFNVSKSRKNSENNNASQNSHLNSSEEITADDESFKAG